ncbi:MAG: hypothetical protein PHV20_09360 [Bacteroidales bacterium]|nr:hypothetical protein [Bacteroidales bacterium]
MKTLVNEFQSNSSIANSNAQGWNDLSPVYNQNQQTLKKWELIMGTSFIVLLCVANLISAVVEYLVSVPIWRETLSRAPWFGALAMLIIGAFISHLFSKMLSKDISDWQFECMRTANPNEDILVTKRKLNNDAKRDFIIGVVMLLICSYFIFKLSMRRVELEHMVDPLRTWNILDWAPVGLFILNSTFLGIYWWYVVKRNVLKSKTEAISKRMSELRESCVFHTEKAYECYKDNLKNNISDTENLNEDQQQCLNRYQNKHSGDIDYCKFDQKDSYTHEVDFLLIDNSDKPQPNSLVVAKTFSGKMLNPLKTNENGFCHFKWFSPDQTDFIISIFAGNNIYNGQWDSTKINKLTFIPINLLNS